MCKTLSTVSLSPLSLCVSDGYQDLIFPLGEFLSLKSADGLVLCWQDGQIDYSEFAAMMRTGNGGIGRKTMRNTLRVNLGDALRAAEK